MATAITFVTAGGMPVTPTSALGAPFTPVPSGGGIPATVVSAGGMPVTLISETGAALDGDAQALIAYMTTVPDTTRAGHINTLVAALKTAGVWTKTRGLWILAAHTSQAAGLNWVSPSSTVLTAVSSPTFTTDRGYAGNGTTSYIDTNLAPVSAEQNSNYMMVWTRTDVNGSQCDFGNARTRIISRSVGNLNTNNNATTSDTVAVANSVGMTVLSRGSSTGYSRFRNGSDLTDATQTSLAPSAINLFIGARNSAGTADTFSTREVAAAAYGNQALNSTEQAAFYTAMNTYMTAVGAA